MLQSSTSRESLKQKVKTASLTATVLGRVKVKFKHVRLYTHHRLDGFTLKVKPCTDFIFVTCAFPCQIMRKRKKKRWRGGWMEREEEAKDKESSYLGK